MKKIISILACVCLLLSVMIVPVSAEEISATISFADKVNRTSFSTLEQVWEQNGIKVINAKGSSTSNVADYANPVRFYAHSDLTIEYPGMTKIEVEASSASYANVWRDSAGATVNGSIATITLPTPLDSFTVNDLDAQTRVKSITVYAVAAEEETFEGTDPEAPIELAVNETTPATLKEIKVPAEGTVFVKAADANGTFHVTSATGSYMLINGMTNQVTADAETDLVLCGYEMVNIYNPGEETLTLNVFLEAGVGPAVGTWDNPEVLELQSNPMLPNFPPSANAQTELAEGNQGHFYTITATADGAFAIRVTASDAEWNNVGYQFNVTNNTTSYQSDFILRAADAEDYYETVMIPVNAGDELLINASTYDPANVFVAPAGTLNVQINFAPIGSYEYPEVLELQANPMMPNFPPSANAQTELAEGNQGYYYTIVAKEDGAFVVSVSANDAEWNNVGYQFNVTNITTNYQTDYIAKDADAEDYYDTVMVPVSAGDEIVINAGTFNPEDAWNAPAGTLNVRVNFAAVGSYEYPEVLELQANPMMPNFPPSANAQTELAEGNQGYYYTIVAKEDGAFIVNVSANDAEWNNVGYQFNVTNITTNYQTDYIARGADAEDYYDSVMVPVSAGDEIIINAGTFNPEDAWNAPAGTLNVRVNFAAVGSYEYPIIIDAAGDFDATVEAESQGYYYQWVATEDSVVTVTINDESGWMYSISKTPVDEEDYGAYYNGDTHWYDDETVVSTESIKVYAGETVTVWVNTYDPESPWAAPAGTVNWTFDFEAITLGDANGDGNVNAQDYAVLMQYLNEWDGVEVNEFAADVNGDGKLNGRDCAFLLQYLNQWDVVLK